ncbi:hypothetical protein SEA_JEGGS_87 [Arthrobacter phage JEGGS]|uniref:Uncharacterized protein n=4 Tax=Mudcatvirus TaxID=1982088 RepID=A0A222Z747_9CAUD|nr:hypothetical protein PQB75_gp090 [Arthrobacter phage Tribby]YP_010666276.1 hypothetical protein PQB76_gp089 [Arthrobacter phage Cheesy]YP_010666566.1 hypothetical protein PQB79_gp087 [Arthrobacter phage Heisenberger]YP_010666666.1 hypothetical protein PQB80_gp087 [Arthrobacter phage JEGGS]ASR80341.1 hypothetical protein SEA_HEISENBERGER_87 [Arthrobacter phage Heisenberger]ASR80541.1 hypothetical protein SEA_TRIBBY_90 [Arthrobacter phage Tribby]ASR84668.1 hypothetical protein SEA_CHEESY_89 
MFWLAFWLVVIGYFILGATRLPKYFEMFREDKWTSDTEAFWYAFMLVFIWPYFEIGKWLKNTVIHHLTREEREEAEYQKAQQIVKDWEAKKE